MSLRCPYCHTSLTEAEGLACRSCGAGAHPPCALELGHCASCGDSRWSGLAQLDVEGWRRVPGQGGGALHLRAWPLEDLDWQAARPALRLDVQRRAERVGGVLSGAALLTWDAPETLTALNLVWIETRVGPGRWGRPGRSRAVERRFPLIERGRLPAGRHRIDVRLPLERGPSAGPGPETRVALELERGRERLRVSLPIRLLEGDPLARSAGRA